MLVRVRVPASTSNLSHGFDCLGAALALANTVTVRVTGNEREAAAPGLGAMIELVRRDCSRRWDCLLPEMAVTVAGDVPSSRGMGSSSTIYLGLAAACQALAGRGLDRDELITLGMSWEGHPDNVAAACLGGFTIAGQAQDGPRWRRIEPPADLLAVLAIPPFEVRTADARRILPPQLTRDEAVRGWQRTALLVGALAGGRNQDLAGLLGDGWHETWREQVNPGYREARAAAVAAGAFGAFISGSGSTVCAFVSAATAQAVSAAMAASYTQRGVAVAMRTVGFDTAGLQVSGP